MMSISPEAGQPPYTYITPQSNHTISPGCLNYTQITITQSAQALNLNYTHTITRLCVHISVCVCGLIGPPPRLRVAATAPATDSPPWHIHRYAQRPQANELKRHTATRASLRGGSIGYCPSGSICINQALIWVIYIYQSDIMYILLYVYSDLGSLALNSSRPYLKLNLPRLLIRADVTGFRILPDEAHRHMTM